MEKIRGAGDGTTRKGEPHWAYAYQINPPRAQHRMKLVGALLDKENGQAKRDARNWTAQLVTEQQVTHILVVSDSPELDRDSNRRLEAMLREMEVEFSVSLPMPVGDEAGPREE